MNCLADAQSELTVKRSVFIAVSRHIESREEAESVVAELKARHPEARHVCHAFIADEKGDDFGYGDDGEPSGTAGKPIYSVLVAEQLRKTMIAVVRYFGGIKLGAGGLTRAYRESAANLVALTGVRTAVRTDTYELECDGETYKKVQAVLRGIGADVDKIMFARSVSLTVSVPHGADVASALSFLDVSVRKTGEKYVYSDR